MQDNIYGGLFQLCEVDFAETGMATKSAQDQFDAVFGCDDCKNVPSPSPLPPVPPAGSDTDHRLASAGHEAVLSDLRLANISML